MAAGGASSSQKVLLQMMAVRAGLEGQVVWWVLPLPKPYAYLPDGGIGLTAVARGNKEGGPLLHNDWDKSMMAVGAGLEAGPEAWRILLFSELLSTKSWAVSIRV